MPRQQRLIIEVYYQLAKYLAGPYGLALLPSFEVRQNGSQSGSQTWTEDRFRQQLAFNCRQYGSKLEVVNEAWTSKPCSCSRECGSEEWAMSQRGAAVAV